MSGLLRFLVAETLAGNAHRLKEYVIAVEVFGRDESFDPRTNALVRVEVSRLRHRLREYALDAGRDAPIRFELPEGSYVPLFQVRGTAPQSPDCAALSSDPQQGDARQLLLQRPSIAVLPFVSWGEASSRRVLPDDIRERLTVALSQIHWLRVEAIHAGQAWRDVGSRDKRVGRGSRIRYLLGGSAGLTGRRSRVYVELSDATTGNVLWAHRYALDVGADADWQEALIVAIIAAVEVRLASAERERAAHRDNVNLDAWTMYQRGLGLLYRFNREDSRRAKHALRMAAAVDGHFASPLGVLAYANFLDCVLGFTDTPGQTISEAVAAGRAAIDRDPRDPMAHFGLARALSLAGKLRSAMGALENAIDLNPGFAPARLGVGAALSLAGRHDEAIDALDLAIGLSPDDPTLWTMENIRALSRLELGQFDQAADDARRAASHPNTVPWCYMTLISALSNLRRDDEAQSVREALFERWPDFSLPRFAGTVPFNPAVTQNWRGGLRRAGLSGL